jgi:pentatricopeptide repeat protein
MSLSRFSMATVCRFGSMPLRECNVLIRTLARRGSFARVMALYHDLCGRGLVADSFTYPFVLKVIGVLKLLIEVPQAVTACSRAGNLGLGRKIHGYMNEVFRLSLPLANALVYMYTKNGCLQEAVKLFEQMPERNIICWTILVSGHYLAGQLDKAKTLLSKHREGCNSVDCNDERTCATWKL